MKRGFAGDEFRSREKDMRRLRKASQSALLLTRMPTSSESPEYTCAPTFEGPPVQMHGLRQGLQVRPTQKGDPKRSGALRLEAVAGENVYAQTYAPFANDLRRAACRFAASQELHKSMCTESDLPPLSSPVIM